MTGKDGGYALFDGAHAPAREPVLLPLQRRVCPTGAGRAAFPRGNDQISFTVLTSRIASSAILALNSPLKFLRFLSLTTCPFLLQATILNYYPEFGVHL